MGNNRMKEEFELLLQGMDDKKVDIITKYIKNKAERIEKREQRFGRQWLIEGLLDANVDDDVIANLVERYYRTDKDEAERLLYTIKTVIHPLNRVCQYMKDRGEAVPEYVMDSKAFDELEKNRNLWKLSNQEILNYLSENVHT